MRAAVFMLGSMLMCLCASIATAQAQEASRAAGFDHAWHDGKVTVAGLPAIPCARCHAMDTRGLLTGRPDHAACFGQCHMDSTPPPRRAAGGIAPVLNLPVCTTCHAGDALSRLYAGAPGPAKVFFPPYRERADHGLRFSHRDHSEASMRLGDCRACHAVPGDASPRPIPHQRCIACHPGPGRAKSEEAGAPSMTDCARCHTLGFGGKSRPHLVRGAFPVGSTFSHAAHLSRGARDCRICHEAVALADAEELPAPGMALCGTCHNQETAFSIVGTSCRRCHPAPASTPAAIRRRFQVRYSHMSHALHAPSTGCRDCHALSPAGQPLVPARNHMPCANAGCHRDEFMQPSAPLCSACHTGTEPWRPLHFDQAPAVHSELGTRFSHRAHLGQYGVKQRCSDCHQPSPAAAVGGSELPVTKGHAGCTGATCHDSGAAPGLSACAGCHELGLFRRHRRQRLKAPWTVRPRFRHGPHVVDVRSGQPLDCELCHAGVAQADGLSDIPAPQKSACQPCHNGAAAFKLTGYGCARCHGGSAEALAR